MGVFEIVLRNVMLTCMEVNGRLGTLFLARRNIETLRVRLKVAY